FAPRRSTSAASWATLPAPNTTRVGRPVYVNFTRKESGSEPDFRQNRRHADKSNALALIVGAGSGLSASLARKCAAAGMRVVLAARNVGKLDALAKETKAALHGCDASDPKQVEALFAAIDAPELVVYNPSYRVRGPFLEL